MIYTLAHGQYPCEGRNWWKRSKHWTVRAARCAVHRYYKDEWSWCYVITDWRGREVYSSDHEIAKLPLP